MREWLVSGLALRALGRRMGRMAGRTLGKTSGLLTGAALLLALLLTVAGCGTKVAPAGAAGATRTPGGATKDAKVFPWKAGDVIKAEYVGLVYGQGYATEIFVTWRYSLEQFHFEML